MSPPRWWPRSARLTALRRLPPGLRGLLVGLGLLGIGYGLSCVAAQGPASTESPEPAEPAGAATAGEPEPESQRAAADVEPAPLLPVLNEEALTARVVAQRALLGKALFEDASGQPVPWISPQAERTTPEPSAVGPEDKAAAVDDALLDSLPGSSGLGADGEGVPTGSRVNGNALGLFMPIEGAAEGSPPLARFYAALQGLREGSDADGKVRVAVYGASHTDADVYPHYLRSYLQERFGDGGHGYIHLARPWRWYGHVDYRVEGLKYWKTEHAQRRKGRNDGLYGLMGCSLSARSKRAFGRVIPRGQAVGSRYELMFLRQPKGGSFKVLVDGRKQATIKTRADAFEPGYHRLELAEGPHQIEVQLVGNGEVRLFGMTIEREQPGVVVDTLGIGGTRAANMLKWDESIWADNLARRDPDLVVMFYGTNEATDENQPIGAYERDLNAVLDRLLRYAPRASCLVMGPGDFPRKGPDGTYTNRARVDKIIAVQRRVALERGCGFWDAKAFMGGDLSMTRWVAAEPKMARNDHIHFTKRGYVRLGMALVDAMMVDFDGGLEAG